MQGSIKKIIEKNGVEYKRLTYIECTGTQYFYSGITASFNFKMELDIDITNAGGQCGCDDLLVGLNAIEGTNGRYIARIGKSGTVLSKDFEIGRHTIILDAPNNKFIIDGDVSIVSRGSTPTSTNMAIMARRGTSGDSFQIIGKLYACKIWESDNLKRDLIPVERFDGALGLLDLVSGNFLTNAGTGIFVKGDYVLVEHIYKPKYKVKTYEKLEYIQTDGSTSYIDTGIYSNEIGYFKLKINGISGVGFFGCYIGNYNIFYVNNNNGKYRLVVGTKNIENQSNVLINNDITLEYNNIGSTWAKLNNVNLTGVGIGTDINKSLHLGNLNMSSVQWGITKIYSFEVKDKSGNRLVNLIPVKRLKDNAIGMLDTLTNTFYANSGTGTFTYQSLSIPEYIEEDVEQVDYIESSGTQYINTGFVATGNIIKNYIKFTNTNVAQHDKALFGSFKNSGAVRGGYIYTDTTASKYGYRFAWGNSDSLAYPTIDGSIVEFELERNFTTKVISLSVNGGIAVTYTNNNATKLTNSEFLFCGNATDTPTWQSSIKCYGYKIIEDGVLKLNLIPVKYGTEYCMLDLAGNKLYHNLGTGSFTGGNRTEVNKITELAGIDSNGIKYYLLDYLQSSGTQRIDTNVNCNNIGKIETRFSIQGAIGTGGQMLYGYYHSSTALAKRGANYLQYTSSSMYIYGGGQKNFSPSQVVLLNHIYRLQVPIAKAGTGYLYDDNGTQRATVNVVATGETGKMTLFVIGGDSTVASHYSKAKIYSFKMYDLDDKLLADFVPAERQTDGVKGMFDRISKTFLINSGTGTFAGNKKEIILVE